MYRPGKTTRTLCAATLSAFMAASAVRAEEPWGEGNGPQWMEMGSRATPLPGHVDFCRRHPDDCRSHEGKVGYVVMTPRLLALLDKTHKEVNAAFTYKSDADNYGLKEKWTYPNAFADCEDYALEKRRRLIAAGWPAASLMIAFASNADKSGNGHAVLIARTKSGDLVLDNAMENVEQWKDVHSYYNFVSVTDPRHPAQWRVVIRQPTMLDPIIVSASRDDPAP